MWWLNDVQNTASPNNNVYLSDFGKLAWLATITKNMLRGFDFGMNVLGKFRKRACLKMVSYFGSAPT